MKLPLFFLLILLCSCKDLNLQKIDGEQLVEEELKSINWSAVDEYPSFKNCESQSDLSTEACFKSVLVSEINATLSGANIVVTRDLSDTLMLTLRISDKGAISLQKIEAKPQTRELIPEIDSLMLKSISQLPEVYPASKHGQPVTTEFSLPVVITIK